MFLFFCRKYMFSFFRKTPKLIPWNVYYPDISQASKEVQEFYYYFIDKIEAWKYVEIGDNLSYLFCYIYRIFIEFLVSRNISRLERKCENIISLYPESKVVEYILFWQSDAYLSIGDYGKARTLSQKAKYGLDIGKILLYSRAGVLDYESWTDFLKVFWLRFLTKYGKENKDWIIQVLDITLKDFKKINGLGFIEFFCQDLQTKNITEDDLQKYKQFFTTEKDFEKYKKMDSGWRGGVPRYATTYQVYLFSGMPLRTRWEWLTYKRTPIMVPRYLITKALERCAKLFIQDAENTYREESWIPKIGEGWVSETELFYKIKKAFLNEVIVHHGSPERLGKQHLDIYFPKRNIGIEYQWKQHLEPVAYFWWEEAFKKQQQRDKKKAKKCKDNWCSLLYVYEWYNLDELVKEINSLVS